MSVTGQLLVSIIDRQSSWKEVCHMLGKSTPRGFRPMDRTFLRRILESGDFKLKHLDQLTLYLNRHFFFGGVQQFGVPDEIEQAIPVQMALVFDREERALRMARMALREQQEAQVSA